MNADDPAIFVQWDTRGFNDTATANCRNGVAGQTLLNLIGYITGSGGANFRNLDTLFLFRTNLGLSQCQAGLPVWYEKFL